MIQGVEETFMRKIFKLPMMKPKEITHKRNELKIEVKSEYSILSKQCAEPWTGVEGKMRWNI
jgi:hypothetical protein